MTDVKWIKLTTGIFDNRKIKHLRKMPDGNNIVLIWVMLLTMAGKCNADGMIFLTDDIPYTTKMLADELGFKESTIKAALKALEQLGMVCSKDGFLIISGWAEHQNTEGMDKIKESKRLAQARWRAKKKDTSTVDDVVDTAVDDVVDTTVDTTPSGERYLVDHAEEDIEGEREIDKNKIRVNYQKIVDMFNSICVSFPSVKILSDGRKKAIKARLNTYSIEDFRRMFEKAEASTFLKGGNSNNWSATFDWLLKDSNMAKVLDGNYDNRPENATSEKNKAAAQLDEAYEMMANWAAASGDND